MNFGCEDLLHVLHQGVACCVIPALVCAHLEEKFGDALTLKKLDEELQGSVWKHYKSWCVRTNATSCGHRFSSIRFGRESWKYSPELASCYKAYTVKMMMYWVHAFMSDVAQETAGGPERARLSYAFAQVQWCFDSSGPWLSDFVRDRSVKLGWAFLMMYQCMSAGNMTSAKRNFKIVPKFHSYLHLLLYVQRTSRNPRPAGASMSIVLEPCNMKREWSLGHMGFLTRSFLPITITSQPETKSILGWELLWEDCD